jgi:hypothetical protein
VYFLSPNLYVLFNSLFCSCYHREIVYDDEGKPIDANEVNKRKKIVAVRNKIEDLIQRAKSLHEGMNFLVASVMNIDASFDHIAPSSMQATREEYECFIGYKIPEQIEIHPPIDIHSMGRRKRIKRAKELLKPHKGKNALSMMHLVQVLVSYKNKWSRTVLYIMCKLQNKWSKLMPHESDKAGSPWPKLQKPDCLVWQTG